MPSHRTSRSSAPSTKRLAPSRPALLTGALLLGSLQLGSLSACHGPLDGANRDPFDGTRPSETTGADAAEARDAAVDQVRSALEEMDFAAAREVIDGLEWNEVLAQAEAAMQAGQPRLALDPLDRALALRPDDVKALALRGRAAFEAASGDSQPGFFFTDATEFLRRAYEQGVMKQGVPGPAEYRSVLEASVAARLIPDPEQALELARMAGRVQDKLKTDGTPLPEVSVPLERAWAQAAFDVYIQEKRSGQPAEAMFRETEDLLNRHAARAPLDPWSFRSLSNLYLWEQRPEDARAQMIKALDLAPEDPTYYEELFSLNWRNFGWEETARKMHELREAGPASPYAQWYAAMADFYLALEGFEATPAKLETDLWEAAEAGFLRARELQPDFEASALQYEASCRSAVGWCHYHKDELDASERAFRSMESLYEGGLQAAPEARMPSGVVGLAFLAQKHHSRGQQDVEALEQAASIGDFLFEYDPENASLANNAGFLNRDAAVMHFLVSQRLARQGAAAEGAAERANLLRRSEQEEARARVLMERCVEAYRVAARLAPDDVRIQNDAGLVLTYYQRVDFEEAERYLRRSIEVAEEQEVWSDPESNAYEAWGDAYQNLGSALPHPQAGSRPRQGLPDEGVRDRAPQPRSPSPDDGNLGSSNRWRKRGRRALRRHGLAGPRPITIARLRAP